MGIPSVNYTVAGQDFDIPVDEAESTDPTEFLIKALRALENHNHVATKGLAVSRGDAMTITSGLIVSTGGLTVTAGGLTVTAGGLNVTAGGLVVTAGNVGIGGTPQSYVGLTFAGNES